VSDWREILEPTPDCIALDRLGEPLTDAERAHVDGCVRCQTERALFREVLSEESSDDSRAIADELRRRNQNVVAFRPGVARIAYQIAAALAVVIGIALWMQMREPSISGPLGSDLYRSARLEVSGPSGDLAQPPHELRWKAVVHATRYHVAITEIDATSVWSSDTNQTFLALPSDVQSRFAPGKTLQWNVEAFRGNESLAVSETQKIRVTP
jgi:hypothetical protein